MVKDILRVQTVCDTFFLASFVLQDLLHIDDPVFIRLCTLCHQHLHGIQLI